MSEEMKMSELFPKAFEVPHNKSFEVQNCHWVTFGEDFHSNCVQDDAIAHAVLNHDRLVEENARLTELAAQKASRADELFNMLERLVSPENCRKDVIHLMSEAESLLDKIKQESNDE